MKKVLLIASLCLFCVVTLFAGLKGTYSFGLESDLDSGSGGFQSLDKVMFRINLGAEESIKFGSSEYYGAIRAYVNLIAQYGDEENLKDISNGTVAFVPKLLFTLDYARICGPELEINLKGMHNLPDFALSSIDTYLTYAGTDDYGQPVKPYRVGATAPSSFTNTDGMFVYYKGWLNSFGLRYDKDGIDTAFFVCSPLIESSGNTFKLSLGLSSMGRSATPKVIALSGMYGYKGDNLNCKLAFDAESKFEEEKTKIGGDLSYDMRWRNTVFSYYYATKAKVSDEEIILQLHSAKLGYSSDVISVYATVKDIFCRSEIGIETGLSYGNLDCTLSAGYALRDNARKNGIPVKFDDSIKAIGAWKLGLTCSLEYPMFGVSASCNFSARINSKPCGNIEFDVSSDSLIDGAEMRVAWAGFVLEEGEVSQKGKISLSAIFEY